jgi:hypothetical protein
MRTLPKILSALALLSSAAPAFADNVVWTISPLPTSG